MVCLRRRQHDFVRAADQPLFLDGIGVMPKHSQHRREPPGQMLV